MPDELPIAGKIPSPGDVYFHKTRGAVRVLSPAIEPTKSTVHVVFQHVTGGPVMVVSFGDWIATDGQMADYTFHKPGGGPIWPEEIQSAMASVALDQSPESDASHDIASWQTK